MFVAEHELKERDYILVGELANMVVYKRELSKHVTSLGICLRDESDSLNTKMLIIDSNLLELVTDAIANKHHKVLTELLGIAYY